MDRIFVNITSYERQESLIRLLDQIKEYQSNMDIVGAIWIDGSKYDLDYLTGYKKFAAFIVQHHGRKLWYTLINNAFFDASRYQHDYFFSLQDDLELKPDFFQKSIDIWKSIDDDNKIAMNLLLDSRAGKSQWGQYPVKKIGRVYDSNWTDMIFMAESWALNEMPQLFPSNASTSSGVARQITKYWRSLGYTMYQTAEQLLTHGKLPSVMNPEERKNNPL